MLEVLFSDSAAGSLKAAIGRRNPPDESAGGIGIVAADANGKPLSPEELEQLRRDTQEKLRRQWADAVPLEGSPQDILPFSLCLSVGPLDEDGIGPLRENVLEQLLCIFPEGRQAAAEIVRAAQRSLGTLLARAPHEPVRFWTDRTPDAACGLCWALAQLRPLGFAHLALRVVADDGVAHELYASVRGLVYARDAVEGSGLSCAVGAYEGDDLALVDLDGEVVDGDYAAELHGDVFHAQDVFNVLTHWRRPPFRLLWRRSFCRPSAAA